MMIIISQPATKQVVRCLHIVWVVHNNIDINS